ncbi:MAG: hypothetical protein WAN30_00290 [Acidimicrobiales bacterium]
MTRAWRELEPIGLGLVPVNTGVFAIRDLQSGALSIHVAGGRSVKGLRGELAKMLESRGDARLEFTYVSTSNYMTLYRERVDFAHRFDERSPFLRRDGRTPAQRGPT